MVELPLDLIELLVGLSETSQEVFALSQLDNARVFIDLDSGFTPEGINCPEFEGLVWKSLFDVCRAEHWLKVHPGALALGHLVDDLLHQLELIVPVLSLSFELATHVRRGKHGLTL